MSQEAIYSVNPKDNSDAIIKRVNAQIKKDNDTTSIDKLISYISVLTDRIALLEANIQRMKNFIEETT